MAVSCTSAAACSAVGFAQARSSCFFATSVPCGAIGLVERWDGKQWSLGVSARPPGSRGVALDGVSCAARAICTAVGFFGRRSRTSGLIEMWDGTHWWIPRSSTARATTELTGVSCPSPTFCAAVGYLAPNYRTSVGIAEHWDGSEWLVDRVAHVDRFSAVSCVSRIACTAIGERPVSLGGTMCNENVVERWNGQAWSVQHATDFGDCYQGSATSLTALSCATISDCTAVGGTSAEGFAGSFVAYWSARGFRARPCRCDKRASMPCLARDRRSAWPPAIRLSCARMARHGAQSPPNSRCRTGSRCSAGFRVRQLGHA